MAEKQLIEALVKRVMDKDPKSILIVSTTREGGVTTIEMEGIALHDVPTLGKFIEFKLDALARKLFVGSSEQAGPPLMHVPKSDSHMAAIGGPLPARVQVQQAVRKTIRRVKKGKRK
jgi:hypothetical protein